MTRPDIVAWRVDDILVALRVRDGFVGAVCDGPGAKEELLHWLLERPSLDSPLRDPHEELPGAGVNPLSLGAASLMVAHVCNLRCVYCYGVDGEYGRRSLMTTELACKAADALLASPEPRISINFFGGEPLLAWSVVVDTVEYAAHRARELGKQAGFSMTTNGVLVTEERAQFLAAYGFHVVVSIDGSQADHDRARPDVGGRGSWCRVVDGARLLLDQLGTERVTARATLRAGHSDYRELGESLADIGFTEVHLCMEEVHPVRIARGEDHTRADWRRRSEHVRGISAEYTAADVARGRRATGPDPLEDVLGVLLAGGVVKRPCGVGTTATAVSTDGVRYPCHRFVGDRRYGDIEPAARARFRTLYQEVQRSCDGCFARRVCAGGCTHQALERLDAGLSSHDARECDGIREVFREAIGVIARHAERRLLTRPVAIDRRILGAAVRVARFRQRRGETIGASALP